MWTVVYIAPNRPIAETIRDRLQQEGLLVMIRPSQNAQAQEARNLEILVPESEVEEAHEVLTEALGR